MRFRKKPVVVDAVQWLGGGTSELHSALKELDTPGGDITIQEDGSLDIHTLEGTMKAIPSDWIIKGVHYEVYPCKAHVFKDTYEEAQ